MNITVELSLYPLTDDYEVDIVRCIHSLQNQPDIQVFTNALSTQIKGSWSAVFSALDQALGEVMQSEQTMSAVMKIINQDCAVEHGHLSI